MKISLLVLGSPLAGSSADSAYHYADAALRAGHEIPGIFFYHEGVYHGNAFSAPAQDETDRVERWVELSRRGPSELVLCVASALRRGILDQAESSRRSRAAGNMHPAFTLAGLGLLVAAAGECDRLLTFGT